MILHRSLHRAQLVALIFFVATFLTACDQTAVGNAPSTTVTIAGSTAMRPLLRELTAAFTDQHPNVVFDLRGGGSTLGEGWAADGRVDIAASTLLVADGEDDTTTADTLVRTPVGLDGIAVIVHLTTGVEALTLLELHDLYTGKIIDWAALGGAEASVKLVSREAGSGTRRLFETRVMGDEPVSLTSVVMPTSAAVVNFVAENPGAVGYVSRAFVRGLLDVDGLDVDGLDVDGLDVDGLDVDGLDADRLDADRLDAEGEMAAPPVRVVAVDGALPSLATLGDQAYPLPQPLYLVTLGPPTGVLRQFTDFVLSPAGQEIVGRYHLPVR